jgi:hypothetical protein
VGTSPRIWVSSSGAGIPRDGRGRGLEHLLGLLEGEVDILESKRIRGHVGADGKSQRASTT